VKDMAGVAFVLGYSAADSGRMLEDYRRTTRLARRVFDRLFYGIEED
jgi:glutamate-ammonia-ligase adenylyltransferase